MSHTRVSIRRAAPDQVVVRCAVTHRIAEAPRSLPSADVMGDLLAQAQAGAPAAARALAEVLGACLFGEAPGALLREAWAQDPDLLVELDAEADLGGWPWELALDPGTGQCPVADGLDLVRVGGPTAAPTRLPARGVLVVPGGAGSARLEAVEAVTRGLGRKTGLDIFPAEPASGPALRRLLTHGAAFVHLDAPARDVRVLLDDGRVPVDRLGLDGGTWLVVLAGHEAAPGAAVALRHQAVPVVVARQMDLDPRAAAAADRELYRALAGGASPLRAMRRIRAALARTCGQESFRWAAPVIWSGAALPGGVLPASVPFPPQIHVEALTPDVAAVSVEPPAPRAAVDTDRGAGGAPRPPISAPIFVRDTVRLLQAGIDPMDAEAEARVAALRALGMGADGSLSPPADLSVDQHTVWLTDRLVDAIGRPDLALVHPTDLPARAARIAARIGTTEASVRRLTHCLAAARAVWIAGDGARPLAEAVADGVFGFHTTHVRCGPEVPVLGAPAGEAPHQGDGWLYRSVAANWRRDELDPRRPAGPQPRTRMRLVSRDPSRDAWRTHLGTWLILGGAQLIPPGRRGRLFGALEDAALSGFDSDGAPFQLAVPADYRVILTGHPPTDLPPWVPVIRAELALAPVRQARWLAEVERRLGPAGDGAEAEQRAQMAAELDAVLAFVAPVGGLPLSALAEAALAHAVEAGGDIAVDEALCVYVAPRLAAAPSAVRRAVRAWLQGDRQALLAAAREARLLDAIARYLDAVDPTQVTRSDALPELGPAAWLTERALDPPAVRVPAFLRALQRP